MHTLHLKTLLRASITAIAALLLGSALAGDSGQHKIVNGVAIYLGVMPAEMILGHSKLHTETRMHGGVPVGEYQHHVLVALFNAASGKRIVGAKVSAQVLELNLVGPQKILKPRLIADSQSYGNYFVIPVNINPCIIRIFIELPGAADVIEAEFEYQQARA